MSVPMTNQPVQNPPTGLFSGYQPPAGSYDEVFSAPGVVRPHWAGLVQGLQALGAEELSGLWEDGRRILRDHGVTYNALDEKREPERPWELDLIPFIVSAEEWKWIESGLIQRARLLNLILHDLYSGPQRLLRDGFIPPALVYANPNFLRPVRGIRVPGDAWLHLHAVDLARSPDGYWWVLDDRTQTPTGMGYALENRSIVARLLQNAFRDAQVQRLNFFFSAIRQTLCELGQPKSFWPRIVLLTPGPGHEAYYEHSLLARFLGFTLAEGADLAVRDRKVFLKTLEGLQRVDVILRRVNDVACDPLELEGDSFVGVPGLVEAARAGNVLVANGLGASAVETPALLPFLPNLCQHVLGEDLQLPSAGTWWCGQAREQHHVMANLDTMIIKGAFPTNRRKTVSGVELSAEERSKLKARIRAHPHEYIGQSIIPLSHAPVWVGDRVQSRPVVMRVYVAVRGNSHIVLPGALTKVSASSTNPVTGLQTGGGSKDTWVLGQGTSGVGFQPPVELESRPAERMLTGVPSRTADNLFWLGRYAERLENTLRVLRAVVSRLSEVPGGRMLTEVNELAKVFHELGFLPEAPEDPVDVDWLEQVVIDCLYEPELPDGVCDLLNKTRHTVSTVRDRFSGDTWRVLTGLGQYPGERPARLPLTVAQATIHDLIVELAALSGMEMESMTRGPEWRFLDFGRRLERASNLCGIIRACLISPRPELLFNPLLEICDSSMTYRRRYFSQPEIVSLLDVLLRDETNPRTLMFQIRVMLRHIQKFPGDSTGPSFLAKRSGLDEIKLALSQRALRALAKSVRTGDAEATRGYFDGLNRSLEAVSEALTVRYFSLTHTRVAPG